MYSAQKRILETSATLGLSSEDYYLPLRILYLSESRLEIIRLALTDKVALSMDSCGVASLWSMRSLRALLPPGHVFTI